MKRGREPETAGAGQHEPRLLIDWHPTFGMELAERDVERRFLFTDLLQAIHAKIQTFPDTDSGSAYEAESMSLYGVALPELLLEALILVRGKRPGQVVVAKGKVLATNQIRGKAMTTVGQVAQQTAEQDQI